MTRRPTDPSTSTEADGGGFVVIEDGLKDTEPALPVLPAARRDAPSIERLDARAVAEIDQLLRAYLTDERDIPRRRR